MVGLWVKGLILRECSCSVEVQVTSIAAQFISVIGRDAHELLMKFAGFKARGLCYCDHQGVVCEMTWNVL